MTKIPLSRRLEDQKTGLLNQVQQIQTDCFVLQGLFTYKDYFNLSCDYSALNGPISHISMTTQSLMMMSESLFHHLFTSVVPTQPGATLGSDTVHHSSCSWQQTCLVC